VATEIERTANAIRIALAESAPRAHLDPLLRALDSHLSEMVERVKSRLPDT
jgi:hypothetical protein